MKPIEFPEQTTNFGEGQEQYQNLPSHRDPKSEMGEMTTCWKLDWKERLTILFTGVLWSQLLTFQRPPQPQLHQVRKPKIYPVLEAEEDAS